VDTSLSKSFSSSCKFWTAREACSSARIVARFTSISAVVKLCFSTRTEGGVGFEQAVGLVERECLGVGSRRVHKQELLLSRKTRLSVKAGTSMKIFWPRFGVKFQHGCSGHLPTSKVGGMSVGSSSLASNFLGGNLQVRSGREHLIVPCLQPSPMLPS